MDQDARLTPVMVTLGKMATQLASLYGCVGCPGKARERIMKARATFLHFGPMGIIGGDFNAPAPETREWVRAQNLPLTVIEGGSTCFAALENPTALDYFMVTASAFRAQPKAQLESWAIQTHKAVTLHPNVGPSTIPQRRLENTAQTASPRSKSPPNSAAFPGSSGGGGASQRAGTRAHGSSSAHSGIAVGYRSSVCMLGSSGQGRA
jgi:hypothetical protein